MLVFLVGMPKLHHGVLAEVSTIPKVIIEKNFQQVIGMAKLKELERLCIYMDVWNADHFNGIRGQPAAEKIHEISPEVHILVWDGREYLSDDNDIAPVFKVTGELKPIRFENEVYLSFDHFNTKEEMFEVMKKFFEGKLTKEDIPHRQCLNMNQRIF